MKMPILDEHDEIYEIQQKIDGDENYIEEIYFVPDKKVGSIIGLGGANILKLENETGCKIKWAPKSSAASNRLFTLAGSHQSVEAAKYMIEQIIRKSNRTIQSGENQYETFTAEIMIPGLKVGLLIGKGGENLRNLQEKAGVKMVIVQDEPEPTIINKSLRISGDPENVEFAQQMVIDFLAEIDTFSVPTNKCGLVIGKGGKTKRDIEQISGAHVTKTTGYSPDPQEEIFIIRGDQEQIRHAKILIKNMIYDGEETRSSGQQL